MRACQNRGPHYCLVEKLSKLSKSKIEGNIFCLFSRNVTSMIKQFFSAINYCKLKVVYFCKISSSVHLFHSKKLIHRNASRKKLQCSATKLAEYKNLISISSQNGLFQLNKSPLFSVQS